MLQHSPEVLQPFMQKTFHSVPANYQEPIYASVAIFGTITNNLLNDVQASDADFGYEVENAFDMFKAELLRMSMMMHAILKHGSTHHFIRAELAKSLFMTELPSFFTWSDLKLPLGGMLMHLPAFTIPTFIHDKGEYHGDYTATLSYGVSDPKEGREFLSHLNSIDPLMHTWLKSPGSNSTKKMFVMGLLTRHMKVEDELRTLNCKMAPRTYLYSFDMDPHKSVVETFEEHAATAFPQFVRQTDKKKAEFLIKANRLAFHWIIKYLLYLQEVPSELPKIYKTKEKLNQTKLKMDFSKQWTPNFIGDAFSYSQTNMEKVEMKSTILELNETRTHASPRMHWRRGHYRRVHTLTGPEPRWIKPTLVNAPEH